MPKTTTKGHPAIRRTVIIVAVVALAVLMWANTKVLTQEQSAAATGEKFSAEEYAVENFTKTIKPHIEERAVDASTLVSAISQDVDAAGKEYGGRDGDSAWAFPVKFTGVAGPVDPIMGQMPVQIDGFQSNVKVVVQMGPAINGSALRDVTGEVHFGMFKNQLEFQSVAMQLNNQVKATVLNGVNAPELEGKTIEVVGAFTYGNPALWIVTPVSIQEASQ